MSFRHLIVAIVAAAIAPGVLAAQALSLGEALQLAERGAYANRIADADARMQQGRADAALRGLLPSVRLEGGYFRTTDPMAAFGVLLRQRQVTQSAFEPARLNDPASIGNLSSGLVVEQPIFNADAIYGRRAAGRAAAAARAGASWTHGGTELEVVRAYFAAVLAAESVIALDSAARAARAHQRVAESLHRNGMVTRSDALLAAVRAGQVDAQLIAARGNARLAHAGLALVLGLRVDTALQLPSRLPDTLAISQLADAAETGGVVNRADVRAARLSRDAAAADQQRATALYLPRVNSFGRLDWNAPSTPFGGRDAWTAGVMLSWSPFSGGAELAERRTAGARRAAAEASADAAAARGELELQQAAIALEVALARMTISAHAVGQSGEAHRIVTRKYEGGLATAVELFDAAAEETAASLAYSDARYQAIIALAERRRAAGQGLGILNTLQPAEQ